jgi:hypothetical protein
MNITENVILDLLPLYFEGEASEETRALVESYFADNPDFGDQMKKKYEQGLPTGFTNELKPEDKMIVLKNTQKLLRLRSIILNTAVVCTLFPFLYFTFYDFEGRVFEGYNWVWSDIGGLCFVLGIVTWLGYFALRFRMRTSGV